MESPSDKEVITNTARRGRLSRRDAIQRSAIAMASGAVLGAGTDAPPALGQGPASPDADLALVNGRILTFDDRNSVARAVAIRDGRIVEVGDRVRRRAQTIDLQGATVIPGLIDSHIHFVRGASEPGSAVRRIETATSIGELQQIIRDRTRTVPSGAFITCFAGWSHGGFTERRLPTAAELDAAAPNNPIYLEETQGFVGPTLGVANSAGIAFFKSRGVDVDPVTGRRTVADFPKTDGALPALQAAQTEEDRRRSTAEFLDFTSSLGITMVTDFGYGQRDNDPLERPFRFALELWRRKELKVRIRIRLSGSGTVDQIRARLDNNINRLGDDVLRLNGMGEGFADSTGPQFVEAAKLVAGRRWSAHTHSIFLQDPMFGAELAKHVAGYQAANAVHPIKDLRWSLAHVNQITPDLAQALADMGCGVTAEGWCYTMAAGGSPGGPPWRMLLDKGLHVGGGTDATRASHINPWLTIYYMTTGRNNAGEQINPGQSVSRIEALKIYTKGSAWHSFDDDKLGSIEVGKLADLAILSHDPLTVSDDQLRRITSVMTLQAGKVVHRSPAAPTPRAG